MIGLPMHMEHLLKTAPGFDVIHFQHEHGLFWDATGFLQCLQQIRQATPRTRIIVTMHTLFHYGSWKHCGLYDGLRHLADGLIAHTTEGFASLAVGRGDRAKLAYVPHGTELGERGDRSKGLKLLGVPDAYWQKGIFGLVFGFQGPSKNTICTVRAFADSLSRRYHDNGVLVIAGDFADSIKSYLMEVQGAVDETGYGRHVVLKPGFTDTADVPHVMAAADFGVLNTDGWTLSASGAAHVYMRYGVPLAVANRPIYNEAIRAGALPFMLGSDASVPTLNAVNAIGALVRDTELRQTVGAEMRQFAERTSWEVVAKKHIELYTQLQGDVDARKPE
jgi:glycosyltransferase involved in cell wall biosynthesis